MLKFQARVRNNYIFEFSMLEPGSKVRPLLINYFKKQISSKALAFQCLPVYPFRKEYKMMKERKMKIEGLILRVLSIYFAAVSLFFLFFSSTNMEIPAQRRTTSREIKL